MLTVCSQFRSDARGSTAIEFGLIAAPLIASFLMIFEIGMGYMAAAQLDFAAHKAGEVIRSGAMLQTNHTADSFKRAVICPHLKGLDCDKLNIQIMDVRTFSTMPDPKLNEFWFSTYFPGRSRSLVGIQLNYPFPVYLNYLTGGTVRYKGSRVIHLVGSTAVINL